MVLKYVRSTGLALILAFALAGLVLAAGPAEAATYTIDPVHSSAVFKVRHFDVANFYGTFNGVSGTVSWNPENPGGSSIEVTIEADSVDTRNGQRDGHVKSPDFLNAKQFPEITFKSTGVEATGDDQLAITGDLTLHGVTKPITVTAEHTGSGEHPQSGKQLVGFEARFTVDRSDYDMDFMVGPLSSEVDFILAIEAGTEGSSE